MKSLNEVIEIVGLKRRAIQEYEKAGVASTPTTTNKYGHLLYDEDHIRHLWLLRFYKELGYKTPDIKQILANPDYDIHEALADHIIALEKKKEDLEHLISVAKALNDLELPPNAISGIMLSVEDCSYDDAIAMLGTAFNIVPFPKDSEELPDDFLTEEDWTHCFDAVDCIMNYFNKQLKYDSRLVQTQIHVIHDIFSKLLSDSIIVLSWSVAYLSPGSECAADVEAEYGPGSANFLYNALKSYCSIHADNPTDQLFQNALGAIVNLGIKKYTTNSEEVQCQVAYIAEFFSKIPVLSSEEQFNMLKYLIDIYASKTMKKLIDNGAERGISWFISRSIEIYCQNHAIDPKGEENE